MTDLPALAAAIAAAVEARAPFEDCSEALGDIAAAYDAQDAVRAILAPKLGGVAGRKIAYNGPGQFQALGLAAPAFAPVYAAWIESSPAKRLFADQRAFCFEPEIAAVLGADLPARTDWTEASVAAHVSRLHTAFELMDRRTDGSPPPMAAIANGVFNTGLAIGGPGRAPAEVEIADLRSVVALNGEVILDRTGAAPMHPLAAAAMIANHFGARGETLRAGEILLCGTHLPPMRLAAPGALRFECGALGAVEFELA